MIGYTVSTRQLHPPAADVTERGEVPRGEGQARLEHDRLVELGVEVRAPVVAGDGIVEHGAFGGTCKGRRCMPEG